MKPTFEIVEYASMRLRFVCATATTLPTPIDSTDSTISMSCHAPTAPPRPSERTRSASAKYASFGAADRNIVTEVGAPW